MAWSCVVFGAAGFVLAAVVSFGRGGGRSEPAGDRRSPPTALAAVIIAFACTLPWQPPFAPGLRLGIGILIGGILGTLACAIASRVDAASPWGRSIRTAGIASAALLGTGLVLVAFPGYPQPALYGFLIGAVVVAVVFGRARPEGAGVELWGPVAVIISASTLLAIFRFEATQTRLLWSAPGMVAVCAIIGAIVGSGIGGNENKRWFAWILGPVVSLTLTAVVSWRVFDDLAILWSSLAGVVTLGIALSVARSSGTSVRGGAAVTLLVLAFTAVAFKFLGGFGIGAGLAASLVVVILSSRQRVDADDSTDADQTARSLCYALCLGAGVLLLRLFLETYSESLRSPDLRLYYTFVALAVGVVFPFIAAGLLPDSTRRAGASSTIGLLMIGTLAATLPLLVVVVWGLKAALGFLIGTLASQMIVLTLRGEAAGIAPGAFVRAAMLILAAEISAVTLAGQVTCLSECSRMLKVSVLAGFTLLALVWAWIASLSATRGEE